MLSSRRARIAVAMILSAVISATVGALHPPEWFIYPLAALLVLILLPWAMVER